MGTEPNRVKWKTFSNDEHKTWTILFNRLEEIRKTMAVPEFQSGLDLLGITAKGIPHLSDINEKLVKLTGWRAVSVEGLESNFSFYPMLARREYPVGCFIRDAKDLNYTPAPDVFHDLYGHIPFFANQAYADFCQEFGAHVSAFLDDVEKVKEYDRLFWFTIEFGLLDTPQGVKIFGGGLLSSYAESLYSLSSSPTVLAFDLEKIFQQPYRHDEFQKMLFLIPNRETLFRCLLPR